jgi:hypothetical protein
MGTMQAVTGAAKVDVEDVDATGTTAWERAHGAPGAAGADIGDNGTSWGSATGHATPKSGEYPRPAGADSPVTTQLCPNAVNDQPRTLDPLLFAVGSLAARCS